MSDASFAFVLRDELVRRLQNHGVLIDPELLAWDASDVVFVWESGQEVATDSALVPLLRAYHLVFGPFDTDDSGVVLGDQDRMRCRPRRFPALSGAAAQAAELASAFEGSAENYASLIAVSRHFLMGHRHAMALGPLEAAIGGLEGRLNDLKTYRDLLHALADQARLRVG